MTDEKKIAKCTRCAHLPICQWCADNTSLFEFPKKGGTCEMCNTDFDDVEEAVSQAQLQARAMMNKYGCEDKERYEYFRGRYDALTGVLKFRSLRGN